MSTVAVVGIWHLGIVNCVGFAEQGYEVVGIELDAEKAASLQSGVPPLFEPGLEELMKKHLASGRLRFTSDPKSVSGARWVVIAYDSPVNDKDEVDIGPVVRASRAVAPSLGRDTPLVITSQLPLGTCETIEKDLRKRIPAWQSGVVYTPENLRLGQAIDRFREPDMIVLGANDERARAAAMELYAPFQTEKVAMNLRSAEMVKHALNTFLATSIAFINEIACLSDRLGADAVAVGKALKLDKRIGNRALMMPGLGFSGGTLARDVTQLRKFSRELKYKSKMLDAIMSVNEGTFDEVIVKLENRLGKLRGKRVGILGLTYKSGTSTVRRSPAIKIIRKLNSLGAKCTGFDRAASADELREYKGLFERVDSPEALADGADAIVLVTEWPEFRDIDFAAIGARMKRRVLVDSKNHLDPAKLAAAGFDYQGFGRTLPGSGGKGKKKKR
jgi:UDPglucose 6-dehydrogenase